MNLERKVGRQRLGEWEFLAATGELRRRGEVRRLEPRAAKALDLLLAADGELVSQEQLIAEVWGGRSLSENSVAVVIGQLRKALDDDAREARLIETIPKRGYRLRIGIEPDLELRANSRSRVIIGVVLAVLVLVAGATFLWPSRQPPLAIAVSDVTNETGNSALGPHVRATSELIVTELSARGYAVRRSSQGDLTMASKMIMWDGKPFLSIIVTDRQGVVRWSLMGNGAPNRVPSIIAEAFDDLASYFPAKGGAERLAKPASGR